MNENMWYIGTHTHTHVYIYTVEYYSAIKKKKRMPLIAKRMDLEIIPSEVSQTE